MLGAALPLHDPAAGTFRQRWQRFLALHETARHSAAARGFGDVQVFLLPRVARAFGRRLARQGWTHDPWPCYSRLVVQRRLFTLSGRKGSLWDYSGAQKPQSKTLYRQTCAPVYRRLRTFTNPLKTTNCRAHALRFPVGKLCSHTEVIAFDFYAPDPCGRTGCRIIRMAQRLLSLDSILRLQKSTDPPRRMLVLLRRFPNRLFPQAGKLRGSVTI